MLKIKNQTKRPRKVLIYGLDGTGKSTFAETYCKEHKLNPVGIDIDDTNFTSIPMVEFERSNHLKVKNQILAFIEDVKKSDFDTIIIDGVSSLLNLLVSDKKDIRMYGDRTKALNKILNELARSKLNFILIGQIDLETEGVENISSAVVDVNSIVNEKYYCYIERNQYLSEVRKLRVQTDYEALEAEAKQEMQKSEHSFSTANNISNEKSEERIIAEEIISKLEKPTLLNAKMELVKICKDNKVNGTDCDAILKCLEVLLNGLDK